MATEKVDVVFNPRKLHAGGAGATAHTSALSANGGAGPPDAWEIKWLVGRGAKVSKGQVIAEVSRLKLGSAQPLPLLGQAEAAAEAISAFHAGQLKIVQDGRIETGRVVGVIEWCSHPVIMGTLCGVCGQRVGPTGEDADEDDGPARGKGKGRERSGGGSGGGGASARGHGGRSGREGDAGSSSDEDDDHGRGGRRRGGPVEDMAKVVMKGGSTLSLKKTEALTFHQDKVNHLLRAKKLSLVLDLDSTLLHATDDPRAASFEASDVYSFFIPGFPTKHYVKTRPGLMDFLQRASHTCELTVYTAATRAYAEEVVKAIDPTHALFRQRIVAGTDTHDLGRHNKQLSRIFPSGTSMAIILDDREDVWKGQQSRHLLTVKPYLYWRYVSDLHNAAGQVFGKVPNAGASSSYGQNGNGPQQPPSRPPNQLEGGQNKGARSSSSSRSAGAGGIAPPKGYVENDPQLDCCLKVIVEAHRRFYELKGDGDDDDNGSGAGGGGRGGGGGAAASGGGGDLAARLLTKDVGDILSTIKREVLQDVRIVFSGLIPRQNGGPEAAAGGGGHSSSGAAGGGSSGSGIPNNPYQKQQQSQPPQPAVNPYQNREHPLWRYAEAFGAIVGEEIDAYTTHVVASTLGTDKCNKGLSMPGVFVVHVDWLMYSVWHCRREDERRFLLAEGLSKFEHPMAGKRPNYDGYPGEMNHKAGAGAGAAAAGRGGAGAGGGGTSGGGVPVRPAKRQRGTEEVNVVNGHGKVAPEQGGGAAEADEEEEDGEEGEVMGRDEEEQHDDDASEEGNEEDKSDGDDSLLAELDELIEDLPDED